MICICIVSYRVGAGVGQCVSVCIGAGVGVGICAILNPVIVLNGIILILSSGPEMIPDIHPGLAPMSDNPFHDRRIRIHHFQFSCSGNEFIKESLLVQNRISIVLGLKRIRPNHVFKQVLIPITQPQKADFPLLRHLLHLLPASWDI